MDTTSAIKRAYARLRQLTPIPADCGELCGRRCCKGSDTDGMILFPCEDMLPSSFSVSVQEIEGFPVHFAVCNGRCKRETRPLSCRIYPFSPYWDINGTLSIIPDPRAVYTCPLLDKSTLHMIDQRFLRAVEDVFNGLWEIDEARPMLKVYSKMLDDYKRFTGQRIITIKKQL